MAFWKGYFDARQGFIKWRDAKDAQKKRVKIFLADMQGLALEESIMQLRTSINKHVEQYHDGAKPPKKKPVTSREAFTPSRLPDVTNRRDMEAFIYGDSLDG